jgi:TonB family protein
MNEICERVRDEAALLGRAPDEWKDHAASCPDCTEFLSNLEALSGEIAKLRPRDASDELVAKTLSRPELQSRTSVRWRTWAVAAAAAACLALAVRVSILRAPADREPEYQYLEPSSRGGGVGGRAESPSSAPEELSKEQADALKSLGYVAGLEQRQSADPAAPSEVQRLDRKLEGAEKTRERDLGRVEDEAFAESKLQMKENSGGLTDPRAPGKKDSEAVGGRIGAGTGAFPYDEGRHAKRSHRDPVYPESAKNAGVEGTVVLELTVNRAGDVVAVRVVSSIPLLDAAAVDAVREWKYEPADTDAPRVFRVPVPFTLEEPEEEEDRSRVDGLRFQEAKGYWANTYLPGDPMVRSLSKRLEGAPYPKIHDAALPALLPYDATSTGALSLFVQADRKGVSGKSRLLVQVGIRASEQQARRRPPMNVGVVLDLPRPLPQEDATSIKAFLESLVSSQEIGDRFRLVVSGAGEVLAPETFRRGPLTVALQDLVSQTPSGSVSDALALALEKVHAGDDPAMPLGTSLVVLVSGRSPGSEIETLARMARTSAGGGVSLSAVGVGGEADRAGLDRLALEGQGRRYDLALASEAPGIVDRELSSASRTVARAVRLRIQLAEGVHLVDVLGSEPLSARESERVRAEERAIDLRLARNLGIEADRGKDEDGIQIVIPAFYAGDAHAILLDVVADGPGPIASVTARYKDLVHLDNTVARASLGLPRSDAAPGPLETSVENDYRELRVSDALRAASEAIARGETGTASHRLQNAMTFAIERDRALLEAYLNLFPRLPASYLSDSLLYASALKRSHSAS